MILQYKNQFIPFLILFAIVGSIFSSSPPMPIDGFGIGSGTHLRVGIQNLPDALNKQQEMGIHWTREDLPWAEVETSPNIFRWNYGFKLENGQDVPRDFNLLLSEASRRKIEVVLILDYRPSYLADNTNPEEFLARWEIYVRNAVDQFGDQVDYWEIQNEPNSRFFWGKVVKSDGSLANIDAAYYSRILRTAYRIIKQKDSNDQVLIGGLVTITDGDCATNPYVYLKQIHDLGAWDAFDIISFHPYWWPNNPEQIVSRGKAHDLDTGVCTEKEAKRSLVEEIRQMRRLVEQFGIKPIWITEIGWNEAGLEQRANERGTTSDIVEADYLVRTYVPLLSEPGIGKVFWYTQYESLNSGEDFSLGEEGQKVLRNLSRLINGSIPLGQFQGQNDQGNEWDDDVYEYRFEKDEQVIVIAWKARGGDTGREVIIRNVQTEEAWQYDINAVEFTFGGKELVVKNNSLSTVLTERPIVILFKSENLSKPTPPSDILNQDQKTGDRFRKWWEQGKKKLVEWISNWWDKQIKNLENEINSAIADLLKQIETQFTFTLNQLCCGGLYIPFSLIGLLIINKRKFISPK